MYAYAKLSLFGGVCEPDRNAASRIVPSANHPSVKALNGLLSRCSAFESVGHVRLATLYHPAAWSYLTKAMVLGGWLRRVWKSRLLMILCGAIKAPKV